MFRIKVKDQAKNEKIMFALNVLSAKNLYVQKATHAYIDETQISCNFRSLFKFTGLRILHSKQKKIKLQN